MSGRRKRQQWPPELKAEALRIAQAEGANIAADRTGINAGTIRSWVARAGGPAPEQNPEVAVAELEAKPPEALSVDDWIELQRLTEARFRRALASGSPSDARWHAISLAITTDKLKAAREADRVERPPREAADTSRLASILDSIAARRLMLLGNASVDELRVQLEKERRDMAKQRRRLQMLLREMLIRRQGGRSQFQGVSETNLPEPWSHFSDDDFAIVKVDTVVPPSPVRPSPYERLVPARVSGPEGTTDAHAESIVDDDVEPMPAVVTSIERARRRSSWGRRSVQEEILAAQGIDPKAFRPPGA